jgi:NAD(P)-dependent dehydrogenase (short-subunit alcohol dehydrogenase family)
MAKAGLEMFTKCSALEMAPYGIRINAVAPSMVDTNMYRYSGLKEIDYDTLKQRRAESNPMQRIAKVEEVAKAVIYLTSA